MPDIAATIDILADDINRLSHHIVNLFGVQARDLEILHSILMCVLLGIYPVNFSVVFFVFIGSNKKSQKFWILIVRTRLIHEVVDI